MLPRCSPLVRETSDRGDDFSLLSLTQTTRLAPLQPEYLPLQSPGGHLPAKHPTGYKSVQLPTDAAYQQLNRY